MPTALGHYLSDPDRKKADRAMQAMMKMQKIVIADPDKASARPRTFRTPDQDRQTPLRRREISFSQGAEWKALISKYIGTIPLSGDALAIEHNASADPPPRTQVSSAMIAKVGAAARYRKLAAPIADPLPFSQRIAPEPRVPV